MKYAWLGACLVFCAGESAVAQEDEAADSIKQVQSDYYGLLSKKNALTEEQALGLIERCWTIYDRTAGEPEEFDALSQVLSLTVQVPSSKLEEAWRQSIAHLREDHLDNPRIAELVLGIPVPRRISKEGEDFLADVEKSSKAPAVKAAFVFKALQADLGKYSEDQLDEAGQKALITKLEDLSKRFGTEMVPRRKTTYAEFAKNTIYAIEHLKIGAVAPEIAADDLDGVPFKLSDYRGKVVMLDFWGYW